MLLLELLPKETQLRRLVESGDSAGLYCVERGFKIADEGLVSAVELDVTEVALLLPPENYNNLLLIFVIITLYTDNKLKRKINV